MSNIKLFIQYLSLKDHDKTHEVDLFNHVYSKTHMCKV